MYICIWLWIIAINTVIHYLTVITRVMPGNSAAHSNVCFVRRVCCGPKCASIILVTVPRKSESGLPSWTLAPGSSAGDAKSCWSWFTTLKWKGILLLLPYNKYITFYHIILYLLLTRMQSSLWRDVDEIFDGKQTGHNNIFSLSIKTQCMYVCTWVN